MTQLDPDTRTRLARLREYDATGLYASDEPSDGTDPGNSLTVTIDPTLRVTGVQIHRIDAIRPPNSLPELFKAAYAAAVAARRPQQPPQESAATARPRPTAEPVTISTAPTRERLNRHSIRRKRQFNPQPRFGFRAATGTSHNQCVTVALPPASPAGPVAVEPGWLQNASASNVARAIVEAFNDAYTKRDS